MAIKNQNFLFLFLLLFSYCNNKPIYGDKSDKPHSSKYELVANWPQLPTGFVLSQPTGIGIDTSEHIFVFHRAGRRWSDPFPDSLISLHTVLEFDNETGRILKSWGADYFIMPHGLTVDNNNNVWVTDVALHQVFKFSHEGELLLKLGIAKISGNDSLHFNLPTDVAVANDGSFYVSDGYGNSRIVKFSSSGEYQFEWGTKGTRPGEFDTPHGITLDKKGNVYVADRQNNRIQIFDANGKYLNEWKNNEPAQQLPSVTIDKATQYLFATDYDYTTIPDSVIKGSTIFQFDTTGNVLFKSARSGFYNGPVCWYHDIAVDKYGSLYVGDILGKKIQKFKLTGH